MYYPKDSIFLKIRSIKAGWTKWSTHGSYYKKKDITNALKTLNQNKNCGFTIKYEYRIKE